MVDLLLRRRSMMTVGGGSPYIVFADPAVEAICVANWSTDGVGLTQADAAAVTSIGTVFKSNTSITSFNELDYFTHVTEIPVDAFNGCTALTEITLPPSLTTVRTGAFSGASSLATVHFNGPGNFYVMNRAFRGCPVSTFPTLSINQIQDSYAFYGNELTYIELPANLSSIGSRAFIYIGAAKDVVVVERRTTPPSLGNVQVFYRDSGGGSFYINTQLKIYVPYSADHSILNAYKTTGNWTVYANYIFELDQNGNIPT